jgi:hypothetical protein
MLNFTCTPIIHHESAFKIEINADGDTTIRLSTRIPTIVIVTSSDRLTCELTIAGNHMGGHTETMDAIIAEHGTGEIWTQKQEIVLPFSCDKEFHKRLIWHDGDALCCMQISAPPIRKLREPGIRCVPSFALS